MLKIISAFENLCDECGWVWKSFEKPSRCAKCKGRGWNKDVSPPPEQAEKSRFEEARPVPKKKAGKKKSGRLVPTRAEALATPKVDKRTEFQPEKFPEVSMGVTLPWVYVRKIEGAVCQICKSALFEVQNQDTRVLKWRCTGVPTHTQAPREEKQAVADAEMTW